MPTKTKKTVPVKSLRKAIQDGMSYEEAANHALKALRPELRICQEGDWGAVPEDPDMEEIIAILFEENNHSIVFEAEEDRDGNLINWSVDLKNARGEIDCLWYFASERTYNRDDAENDEIMLNKFIRDFYGIEEHAERKLTKKEARTKAKQIRAEIAGKQKIHRHEIKVLQAELKKLAKIT